MKKIITRLNSPTPTFWKKIQKIGLILGGISTVIATAPISLPATITGLAGYFAVASGSIAAISQLTVEDSKTIEPSDSIQPIEKNIPTVTN